MRISKNELIFWLAIIAFVLVVGAYVFKFHEGSISMNPIKCVPLFMLLKFCGKNKGNKNGRVSSEGLGLNSYVAHMF